jgi:hypothetical protein
MIKLECLAGAASRDAPERSLVPTYSILVREMYNYKRERPERKDLLG